MLLPMHSVLLGNKLTRNLSGNIRPQSSQLTEPLWTDPGIKSGISVHELIPTLEKKKTAQVGNKMVQHSPKILTSEEKATTTVCERVHTSLSLSLSVPPLSLSGFVFFSLVHLFI